MDRLYFRSLFFLLSLLLAEIYLSLQRSQDENMGLFLFASLDRSFPPI